MNEASKTTFRSLARRLCGAWLLLLALLAASTASAYLPLGRWSVLPGLFIALIKSMVVGLAFMRFAKASSWSRVSTLVAICAIALLSTLVWVEYATRDPSIVPWQTPKQLPALRSGAIGNGSRMC